MLQLINEKDLKMMNAINTISNSTRFDMPMPATAQNNVQTETHSVSVRTFPPNDMGDMNGALPAMASTDLHAEHALNAAADNTGNAQQAGDTAQQGANGGGMLGGLLSGLMDLVKQVLPAVMPLLGSAMSMMGQAGAGGLGGAGGAGGLGGAGGAGGLGDAGGLGGADGAGAA
jgi:hypothetical protein